MARHVSPTSDTKSAGVSFQVVLRCMYFFGFFHTWKAEERKTSRFLSIIYSGILLTFFCISGVIYILAMPSELKFNMETGASLYTIISAIQSTVCFGILFASCLQKSYMPHLIDRVLVEYRKVANPQTNKHIWALFIAYTVDDDDDDDDDDDKGL